MINNKNCRGRPPNNGISREGPHQCRGDDIRCRGDGLSILPYAISAGTAQRDHRTRGTPAKEELFNAMHFLRSRGNGDEAFPGNTGKHNMTGKREFANNDPPFVTLHPIPPGNHSLFESSTSKEEVGSWKSEVRSQKTEDGSWKTEVGSPKSEDGSSNTPLLQHSNYCITASLDYCITTWNLEPETLNQTYLLELMHPRDRIAFTCRDSKEVEPGRRNHSTATSHCLLYKKRRNGRGMPGGKSQEQSPKSQGEVGSWQLEDRGWKSEVGRPKFQYSNTPTLQLQHHSITASLYHSKTVSQKHEHINT